MYIRSKCTHNNNTMAKTYFEYKNNAQINQKMTGARFQSLNSTCLLKVINTEQNPAFKKQ